VKQAVVFHLEAPNWNVIEAFLMRTGQHALITRQDALQAPEAALDPGRCSYLGAFLPEKDRSLLEDAIRRVLDRSPFLFVGKEWDALCAKHGLPADRMREAMRLDLGPEWQAEALLVESLERAAATHAIRAVVVNEEYSAESVALGSWARQRSIPVLHLHSGLASDGDYFRAADLQADAIAIAGPRDAEALQDMGLPESRLLRSGNPGWIRFSELASKKAECRNGLAELIGWGNGPLLVFGTGAAPLHAVGSDAAAFELAARAFFRCAKSLSKQHPAANWAVLLRETDPEGLEDVLKAWAASEGAPAARIHCFRNNPELFLAAAEAVVSVDAALSVEALLAGTRAINVLTDSGWRMGPAFAAESGVLEVDPEGLPEAVSGCLDARGADPRAMAAAMSVYHPAQSGDPVKNVVDWLSACLAPA
jgi:hypothetical protein